MKSKKQMKSKKTQNKKKSPRKTSQRGLPRKGIPMALARGVCSVTNPFCPESFGARWPDNSYTKSACWDVNGALFNLGTDANGTGAFMVTPGYGFVGPANNAITAGVGSFGPGWFTPFAFPTGVVRYRITSYGLMVNSAIAPLNASGIFRVRLFSPSTGASLSNVDLSTVMADATYDIPVSRLCNTDLFINLSCLGTDARLFRDVTIPASLSAWSNPGWQIATCAVVGAQASQSVVCTVKVFAHYEVIFGDGEANSMFADAPPKSSPVVQDASAGVLERVGNFITGSVASVDEKFKRQAVAAIAETAFGFAFGGPPGAALALADRSISALVD